VSVKEEIMNLTLIQNRIRRNLESFGFRDTMYDIALRAANHVTYVRILKAMKIGIVNPGYLDTNPRYQCMFLSKEIVKRFASDKSYELTESFLEEAYAKGDQCFGILDGDVLASYGWYSNKPTDITDHLTLHFSPEYIYMYKGFTHDNYRGQRLHAIGMNLALREYLNLGFKGLVSYVESNNYSSLKSCYRMGYKDFGAVAIVKAGQRHFIYASPGCQPYGFNVIEKERTLLQDYKLRPEADAVNKKEAETYKARA
jgi:hypothetical protein